MAIGETKLNAFMGNFVHDLGAVMHAATIVVGDHLGLYKALAEGPLTADTGDRHQGRLQAFPPRNGNTIQSDL